jgi:hypothetical protein
MDQHEIEGGKCPECGTPARLRTCSVCGGTPAWLIDCGHYAQPRPISAGPDGKDYCDECWKEESDS